jgi:DNA adenine methylase
MKWIIRENDLLDGEYVEAYAGGAGIAWSLLFEEYVSRVHINDLDCALMWFWQAVVDDPDGLCSLIAKTPVTIEEWHQQRAVQAHPDEHSGLEMAFSTLFLNRTNRSGILRGGVIGGKNQTGAWKLDARFHKEDLIRRIQRISRYRDRISLYCMDAAEFIGSMPSLVSERALIYLDPPYFRTGQELYENHYDPDDHKRISSLVRKKVKRPWVVSYDDVPEVIGLYLDFPHLRYHIEYSAQRRYEGAEVMFHHPELRVPTASKPTSVRLQ